MKPFQNFSNERLIREFECILYTEQWSVIVGFENYLVSSFGRFKSRMSGKILKQQIKGKYLTISFPNGKAKKKFRSHRLVGLYFVKNLYDKPEINHDDFDTENNFFKNLDWVTNAENIAHAILGGKIKTGRNDRVPVGEFPIRYQKVINTETKLVYDSVYHLSKEIGREPKEIRRRLSGERYNDTPFVWLKGAYTFVYAKRNVEYLARYNELKNRIYGVSFHK